MPGDPVTISKEAHMIAIKYGKNVSRGIVEMEAVIQKQKKEIEEYSKFVVMRV